jgi:hypothetical protein
MSKLKRVFRTCRINEVPPFCFMKPGMTPEEGALAAVKAMEMTLPIDALETLFRLRDAREAEQMSAIRAQQRAAKSGGKSKATSATHNATPKEGKK